MNFTCTDRYEFLRKAAAYENAASTMGEHLHGYAQALRNFAERTLTTCCGALDGTAACTALPQ